MGLLNVALPTSSFTLPCSTFLNEGNRVLARQSSVPSLRRRSSLSVKCSSEITRSDFPSSFKFGASSSALQTESYPNEGGRGPSTWDYVLGDVYPAVDSYHKYKEDIRCLKEMNADVYRFSISWSRILPTGKKSGGINQEGIDFYNNLIDEVISNGIEPFVTLFHFELPAALERDYKGLVSSNIVDDFNDYADICFKAFGDRVKHWVTVNEPEYFIETSYMTGQYDPKIDPYKAAHNLILAHATAVKTYRDHYQPAQNGEIGMVLNFRWLVPMTNTPSDSSAADRAWDFMCGWFLDPLVTGDYPFSMKTIVRDRLPKFSDAEKKLITGSYDFFGVNYYTSRYAKGIDYSANDLPVSYSQDQYVEMLTEKDGLLIGPKAEATDWVYIYAAGLHDILVNLKLKYNNPLIYVTENGYPETGSPTSPLTEKSLQDDDRIKYIKAHLDSVRRALRDEVNVDGYFVWSLMDSNELGPYDVRFGLNYTDYTNDFKRTPKKSAQWFKQLLTSAKEDPQPFEPLKVNSISNHDASFGWLSLLLKK